MINLLFALIGVSAGALVSGGICSLLTTIGIVNRLAFKTKTVSKIKLYENTILFLDKFNVIEKPTFKDQLKLI